ncbi:hypothetical protein BKK81_10725 [Cupriavidus sp. USMAHM13]|uniref:DUF2878 domain-containing protein n=1 Tax=Cupriavidus sp. USMAHM13 TaxID=1389192 RepID=UPI0008A67176|nr:DUF2878 domain-containing protein [Cupriavidus sp. USMAHM13]AOY99675.1 hypothetical protein BKK81_10725 [Cupriavidus sp. USMAHM13]
MRHTTSRRLAYALLGQAGWFAAVLGAVHGAAWLGPAFTLTVLALHLWQVPRPGREACLLAGVALGGAFWETTLVRLGLVQYAHVITLPGGAPLWLVGLWILLALQLNVLFSWLRGRPWLAALLGAVAGPLSFRAGVALGAATFPDPVHALAVLAAGWALALPLLVHAAARCDGTGTPEDQCTRFSA